MKLLSFLKPLSRGPRWLGQWVLLIWRAGKFGVFPSGKNLLVSFWYDFIYYKKVIPEATAYAFLDQRVAEYEIDLRQDGLSRYKKQLRGQLLKALYNPRLRSNIITFLESPNPEESYLPLWDEIKGVWRLDEEEQTKPLSVERPQEPKPADVSSRNLEVAGPETVKKKAKKPSSRPDARTYVIAADIYFELAGKQVEFRKLIQDTGDLKEFLQEKFGMTHVPETFKDLRKYSYMEVINNGSDAERGQLKPQLRQIVKNPNIFGEAIAKRARKLLDDYLL
jgi:hypothetical protein